MQAQMQPRPDLTRPALATRLHALGRHAEDCATPIELGGTLLVAVFCLLLPLGILHWLESYLYATLAEGRSIGWLSGDWISLLAVTASLASCAGGAVAASRGIRGIYRRAYHAALTALHSTELPLVIADESMRSLVRQLREASPLRRWVQPAWGADIESQLRFAARYFPQLLAVARSADPTKVPPDGGWLLERGWGTYAILFTAMVMTPWLWPVTLPTAIGLLFPYAFRNLRQHARLAALCDFYLGRQSPTWAKGWRCAAREWHQLRQALPAATVPSELTRIELITRPLHEEPAERNKARVAAGLTQKQ